MKRLPTCIKVLLLLAVIGSYTNLSRATTTVLADEVSCELSSSEITSVQAALAEYKGWRLSDVAAHTISVTPETCDATGPVKGTITLEFSGTPCIWNWERQGGGSNVIVIWPT